MIHSIVHRIRTYSRHLRRAKTRFKVHSPFVFELVDDILRNLPEEDFMNDIEHLRTEMKQSGEMLIKTDLGAGGQKNRHYELPLRHIARTSLQNSRSCRRMLALARFIGARNMLELGASLGISSLYLAKGLPDAKLSTIEACPQTAAKARENFNKLDAHNIDLIVKDAGEAIRSFGVEQEPFDFVYFDANHRYKPTLEYFNAMLKYSHEGSVFVFDDIHWSEEMSKAWSEIIQHDKVSISLDFYSFGLLFFRKRFERQNFRLKL